MCSAVLRIFVHCVGNCYGRRAGKCGLRGSLKTGGMHRGEKEIAKELVDAGAGIPNWTAVDSQLDVPAEILKGDALSCSCSNTCSSQGACSHGSGMSCHD